MSGFAIPAVAADAAVSLYLSAPFVQGSHVDDESTLTETFNGMSSGACPATTAVGDLSHSGCVIEAQGTDTPVNGDPLIGSSLTSFVSATPNSTFTFTNSVKYVGFWWMMGSSGNSVTFRDSSDNVLATMSSAEIMSFLGISYASVTTDDTGTLTTVDGSSHLRKLYFQNPGRYSGTPEAPVNDYDYLPTYANEPWVYLNLFLSGDVDVKKVNFSGAAFEMDNLTVSTEEQGPKGNMVLVSNVLGTPPTGQVMTWTPTNTSAALGSGPLTPDNLASVTIPASGGGSIAYSVVNSGTTGCIVDSATGSITATGVGDCIVRATAASTASFYTTSIDRNFTFTTGDQVVSWPVTNIVAELSDGSHTPNLNAVVTTPATAGGAITYSVQDAGLTGCTVDSASGLITYTAIGECVIRATAAAIDGYNSASSDATFTIVDTPPQREESSPTPFVITGVASQEISSTGGQQVIYGLNLGSTDRLLFNGVEVQFSVRADGSLMATTGVMSPGLVDVTAIGEHGTALMNRAFKFAGAASFSAWTKRSGNTVTVYAKNLVGVGKVQFLVDGKEIAWVRAIDGLDPKLRLANGTFYLVRTVEIKADGTKTRFEVKLNGERVRHNTYIRN